MKAMEDKETLHHSALRALTWAAIFLAVAVFWGGVGLAVLDWVR